MMIKFLFDLDGTLTKAETLPLIAKHFHLQNSMAEMTKQSILGTVPFEENFIKRVALLKHLPIDKIASFLENIPLFEKLIKFIQENQKDCVLVTSNIDVWVARLCTKIGCTSYFSDARVYDNQIVDVTQILAKENIVKKYQNLGFHVVFIGDGNNDVEAIKCANTAIACGLLHSPPEALMDISHYCIFEEEELYNLLCRLKTK